MSYQAQVVCTDHTHEARTWLKQKQESERNEHATQASRNGTLVLGLIQKTGK